MTYDALPSQGARRPLQAPGSVRGNAGVARASLTAVVRRLVELEARVRLGLTVVTARARSGRA